MQIELRFLQITGKAGLRFDKNDIEPPRFSIPDHLTEGRAAGVGARPIFIHIDLFHLKAVGHGVTQQQAFLVVDALGLGRVPGARPGVAQAAVECSFQHIGHLLKTASGSR